VYYMQRPFKGYPNVLVCAPMGPQHSERGGRLVTIQCLCQPFCV
jgi:hypothetical protein